MSACTHPRTGTVTSHPNNVDDFVNVPVGSAAYAHVCDLPECIAEATAWVERVSGRKAYHVPDEVQR